MARGSASGSGRALTSAAPAGWSSWSGAIVLYSERHRQATGGSACDEADRHHAEAASQDHQARGEMPAPEQEERHKSHASRHEVGHGDPDDAVGTGGGQAEREAGGELLR